MDTDKKTTNKTYRTDIATQAALNALVRIDARAHSEASALFYVFHDTAKKIKNGGWSWDCIQKDQIIDDCTGIDEKSCNNPRSFSPIEEDWSTIVESFRSTYAVDKVNTRYLIKLLIIAARQSYKDIEDIGERSLKVIKTEDFDIVSLFEKLNNKAAELIRAGRVDVIMKFLEER